MAFAAGLPFVSVTTTSTVAAMAVPCTQTTANTRAKGRLPLVMPGNYNPNGYGAVFAGFMKGKRHCLETGSRLACEPHAGVVMAFWNRRKSLDAATHLAAGQRLKPTLGWPHLMALGVGAIVGTGIYTLTGIGAGLAGPAVILSFALAGVVCACAALAYAEMATMMPVAGSAYTYSYAVIGELIAWIVGWSLILEYTVVCAAVAVGWSAYAAGVIHSLHLGIPDALLAGPQAGGVLNLPAVLISLLVAGLLALGTRESATVNFLLVVIKLVALGAFVLLALPAFDNAHFSPFAPNG